MQCSAQGHMSCIIFYCDDAKLLRDNGYGFPIRCTKNTLHIRCTESGLRLVVAIGSRCCRLRR